MRGSLKQSAAEHKALRRNCKCPLRPLPPPEIYLMPQDEPTFLAAADATLARMFEALEAQDKDGVLELDETSDGFEIELKNGTVLVLTRHRIAGQIWYASPRLGGLHFDLQENGRWLTRDCRDLQDSVADDLRHLSGQTHWIFL